MLLAGALTCSVTNEASLTLCPQLPAFRALPVPTAPAAPPQHISLCLWRPGPGYILSLFTDHFLWVSSEGLHSCCPVTSILGTRV